VLTMGAVDWILADASTKAAAGAGPGGGWVIAAP